MVGSRYLSCAVVFALVAAVGGQTSMDSFSYDGTVQDEIENQMQEKEVRRTVQGVIENRIAKTVIRKVRTSGIKIAMLFRGESFRMRAHWRRTCDDNTLDKQKRVSDLHNGLFAKMAKLGIDVDVYGVTYACKNGRDYADHLPDMYVPKMKAFDIVPYNGSTQLTTMAHVLRRVLATGKIYDGIYLLRWDHDYTRALTHMSKSSCFADSHPRQLNYYQGFGVIPDKLLYVPGAYAEQMLAFMELDASPCCKWPCARVCSTCAQHFLEHLGKKEEQCSQPLGCHSSCLGSSASLSEEYLEPLEVDEESSECYEPLG